MDKRPAAAEGTVSEATWNLLEHLPVGTYVTTLDAVGNPRFLYASDRWLVMCGLEREALMADQSLALKVIHPDDRGRMLTANLEAQAQQRPFRWEGRLLIDGRDSWVLITSNPRPHPEYDVLWEGVMIDISGYKALEMELRVSEKKFRTLVEQANDVIYTLNFAGEFEYLSPNVQENLGFRPEEVSGRYIGAIVHPDDLAHCERFLQNVLESGVKQPGLEYRVRHADGGWRWHVTNASPLFDADGRVSGMLGIGRDISDRKDAESRVHYLASHDALTELSNREAILEALASELHRPRGDGNAAAVGAILFIDLDGFKPVNDHHGHAVGDRVLQIVARRLDSTVRETDSVGRLGGDEFLVLLPGAGDAGTALTVAGKILARLREPVAVNELRLQLSCSIGIALFPGQGDEVKTLVRKADDAMYVAKRGGRDRAAVAEPVPRGSCGIAARR
ncbi:sensor domain-containing diguanylate cyclase [Pseudohaliea rubra]|uniref:Uncharacterized protein n=1 Tax=Pseudohaliea rubra DSM 19751 TaxID=1265313 RepID=A0A095X0I9_9GAMM|nr:sensor domain-containing diguanylate cyclase [Pseudohaliea rubra]KGE04414.1 hypothetical protein HRUBRA_00998 [Pseudohaliea rubra DSM 19751]